MNKWIWCASPIRQGTSQRHMTSWRHKWRRICWREMHDGYMISRRHTKERKLDLRRSGQAISRSGLTWRRRIRRRGINIRIWCMSLTRHSVIWLREVKNTDIVRRHEWRHVWRHVWRNVSSRCHKWRHTRWRQITMWRAITLLWHCAPSRVTSRMMSQHHNDFWTSQMTSYMMTSNSDVMHDYTWHCVTSRMTSRQGTVLSNKRRFSHVARPSLRVQTTPVDISIHRPWHLRKYNN